MIQTIGVFHMGIPADDLDWAERFYTEICMRDVGPERPFFERYQHRAVVTG